MEACKILVLKDGSRCLELVGDMSLLSSSKRESSYFISKDFRLGPRPR